MHQGSKHAQMAMRKIQGTVRKVAKSCNIINERLTTLETRTETLENDLADTRTRTTAHDAQLTDIQWKLEDHENRQR